MIFGVLLVIPLLVALAAFLLLDGITWKEFLLQVGAQLVVAGASAGIVAWANTSDVEIWNGVVTGQHQVRVSCSHSYSCHCRTECHETCTGSGKNRSCAPSCNEVCDTCYEHTHDWDWTVTDSTGETYTIARVDRQGAATPPRWAAVTLGEPTATDHSFTNYIKAAPDTLFRHQGLTGKYKATLPAYPCHVYDYYRLDRMVLVNGAGVDDFAKWNRDLSDANGAVGKPSQANLIVVVTRDLPREWFYALEQHWTGGKKNDVVLVLGTKADNTIQWASVMAWAKEPIFQVKLRDDVLAVGKLDREAIFGALRTDVSKYFHRKPMKDFQYLEASVVPTTTEWVVSLLVGLLVAAGLAWLCEVQDVFGEEWRTA